MFGCGTTPFRRGMPLEGHYALLPDQGARLTDPAPPCDTRRREHMTNYDVFVVFIIYNMMNDIFREIRSAFVTPDRLFSPLTLPERASKFISSHGLQTS